MTVGGITDCLKQHWPVIREQLLSGTYEPKPVRRVEIPIYCSLLSVCLAVSQVLTGTISGVVTDATQAVVPNLEVVHQNNSNGMQ